MIVTTPKKNEVKDSMEMSMEPDELYQRADWKTEKHVPVIECPGIIKADELCDVKVSIGKEITHPNTTEHHIAWISVLFKPEDEKFPYHIGQFLFNAHGASVQGPNTSTVYTHHAITTSFKTSKSGTLLAMGYCNIHGLWQSTKEITVK
jgi:superoxide reductase